MCMIPFFPLFFLSPSPMMMPSSILLLLLCCCCYCSCCCCCSCFPSLLPPFFYYPFFFLSFFSSSPLFSLPPLFSFLHWCNWLTGIRLTDMTSQEGRERERTWSTWRPNGRWTDVYAGESAAAAAAAAAATAAALVTTHSCCCCVVAVQKKKTVRRRSNNADQDKNPAKKFDHCCVRVYGEGGSAGAPYYNRSIGRTSASSPSFPMEYYHYYIHVYTYVYYILVYICSIVYICIDTKCTYDPRALSS